MLRKLAALAAVPLLLTGVTRWDDHAEDIPASAWLFAERFRDVSLDPRDCTDYTYLGATGTSDTTELRDPDAPAGLYVGAFGEELGSSHLDVRAVWVPYPARAVFTSYESSVAEGRAATAELMGEISRACPDTRFLLAGYSQGADVMTGVLESVAAGEGPVSQEAVARAVFVGNPRRAASGVRYHGTADPGSRGILAVDVPDFGPLTGRIAEVCNEGDVWCDAPPSLPGAAPSVASQTVDPGILAADPADVETLVRFALSGSADHTAYGTVHAEGSDVPMAEWAFRFLLEG